MKAEYVPTPMKIPQINTAMTGTIGKVVASLIVGDIYIQNAEKIPPTSTDTVINSLLFFKFSFLSFLT